MCFSICAAGGWIVMCFVALSQQYGLGEAPILHYFKINYTGEIRQRVRRPPTFEHTPWSVYKHVINNLPRTTNALKGWHNAFARRIGQYHTSIWKFTLISW